MKKIFIIFCLMLAITVVSCEKPDNDNNNGLEQFECDTISWNK